MTSQQARAGRLPI